MKEDADCLSFRRVLIILKIKRGGLGCFLVNHGSILRESFRTMPERGSSDYKIVRIIEDRHFSPDVVCFFFAKFRKQKFSAPFSFYRTAEGVEDK